MARVLFHYFLVMICSPRYLLKQEVPKIVRSVNKQLREKSIKTKVKDDTRCCFYVKSWASEIYCCIYILQVGAFSVLKELVIVLPDCLADHIGSLTPGIEKALCVSSSLSIPCQRFEFDMIVYIQNLPLCSGQIFDIKFKDWGSCFYEISVNLTRSICFSSLYQGNV